MSAGCFCAFVRVLRGGGGHGGAFGFVGMLECRPPVGQFAGGLAELGAQHEEVVGGAEPRLRQQSVRPCAAAVVELGLQYPDFAEGGGVFLRHAPAFFHGFAQFGNGFRQGGSGFFAAFHAFLPIAVERFPHQGGEDEADGNGFVGAQAFVGVFQGGGYHVRPAAARCLLQCVEQRVDGGVYAQCVKLVEAAAGVA